MSQDLQKLSCQNKSVSGECDGLGTGPGLGEKGHKQGQLSWGWRGNREALRGALEEGGQEQQQGKGGCREGRQERREDGTSGNHGPRSTLLKNQLSVGQSALQGSDGFPVSRMRTELTQGTGQQPSRRQTWMRAETARKKMMNGQTAWAQGAG